MIHQPVSEVRDCTGPCPVCLLRKEKEMKFVSGCEHWFCVDCCSQLLKFYETRRSPAEFISPPCPIRCKKIEER